VIKQLWLKATIIVAFSHTDRTSDLATFLNGSMDGRKKRMPINADVYCVIPAHNLWGISGLTCVAFRDMPHA
jgi:hypothetical protein